MLTELYGKGGRVCKEARKGNIRCGLIVRPNSEDVITGRPGPGISGLESTLVSARHLEHRPKSEAV